MIILLSNNKNEVLIPWKKGNFIPQVPLISYD